MLDSDLRFHVAATIVPVVIYRLVSTGEADRVKNPSFSCLSPSLMNLLAAMFSFGQLPFLLFSRELAFPVLCRLSLFFWVQRKLFFGMVVLEGPGVWCH